MAAVWLGEPQSSQLQGDDIQNEIYKDPFPKEFYIEAKHSEPSLRALFVRGELSRRSGSMCTSSGLSHPCHSMNTLPGPQRLSVGDSQVQSMGIEEKERKPGSYFISFLVYPACHSWPALCPSGLQDHDIVTSLPRVHCAANTLQDTVTEEGALLSVVP